MKSIVTFVAFLALRIFSFGQISSDNPAQALEEHGMKLILEAQLSPVEISQLLSFDFEPYREKDEFVIIKVVNGPMIQLYSSNQFETGKADLPDSQTRKLREVAEEPTDHHDGRPGDGEMRILQVRIVDVFGTEQSAK